MKPVWFLSGLLSLGIVLSQSVDLTPWRPWLTLATMICLSYIMIEVGLEFMIDKKKLGSYGADYLIAMTAAAFPWIFAAAYFVVAFGTDWKESLLLGRFAAPTSAGILFTMLTAAGLASTWLFRKVRVLAIFDDLDTILLMIPLKIMLVGWKPELAVALIIIGGSLWAAFRYLHSWHIPAGKSWILAYGALIAILSMGIEKMTGLHMEVLLPAFALGCVVAHPHEDRSISLKASGLDKSIKGFFMFLVGCSLPMIDLQGMHWGSALIHVATLTLLSNIGKCFPIFCYRGEATLKERIAVAVAMFPRGEVGAGVLLVSIGYGLSGAEVGIAGMSLALNLLMTGVFITLVLRLVGNNPRPPLASLKSI